MGLGAGLTNQQLVDKDPDGPPVALPAVDTITALRLEHLGGDVVRRAHGCVTVHHARLPEDTEHRRTLQNKSCTSSWSERDAASMVLMVFSF